MKRYSAMIVIALLAVIALLLAASGPGTAAPAKEIVIGNLQDLSGPTSVWGNAVTKAPQDRRHPSFLRFALRSMLLSKQKGRAFTRPLRHILH